MKKIICILICIFMLIPAFTSCSKPPEYADIEERFKELVSASGEINEIFFGEGLPTYKRVYDDLSTFVGENGSYYYYELEDDTYGMMYAFRPMENYGKDFTYLQILDAPDGNRTPYYENSGLGIYL